MTIPRAAALLLAAALAPLALLAGPEASREDLARAYLEFEQAFLAHPPPPESVAEVSRAFDAATMLFLGNRSGESLRGLHALTARLLGQSDSAAAAFARAAAVRVEPRVFVAGSPEAPLVTTALLYPVPEATGLDLVVVNCDGRRLPVGPGVPGAIRLPAETVAQLTPGLNELRFAGPAGLEVAKATFSLVPRPLADIRAGNEKAIAALRADTAELAQAVASVRARNALLTDTPSPARSAEILADPAELALRLTAEIRHIAEKGESPYRGPGDWWRVILVGGGEMPVRVHVPVVEDVPAAGLPLVIALHGAGGDENMFHQGYGAGLLVRLSDERGFVLAAPLTTRFSTDPAAFDALVGVLAAEQRIDARRIYLLGHSLGAMAGGIAARARKDRVAAVCLIAGAPPGGTGDLPPSLRIAGALDPLVRSPRVKPDPDRRVYPDHGHTTVVAAALPEALDFLLARSLPPR